MQKKYTQLLWGVIIGVCLGILLGKFVWNHKATNSQSAVLSESNNKDNVSSYSNKTGATTPTVNQKIPQKVYEVLQYIKTNGTAKEGYVGGRVFQNRENKLARNDKDGNKIDYQEWDVNPKVQGQHRGAERIVTGSDGRSWYTSDHYRSFTEIK